MTDETAPRSIRVDAHQHFWPQPMRWLYPWMTDEHVHDALVDLLTGIGMPDTAQAKVFGENARRFYVPSA
jgi:predicted TIM-barrel fold metal-dependent hydrolase